jgi:acyl carrier protein
MEESVVSESVASTAPMSRSQLLELVRTQLAEILEIEPESIAESASFADDLNADSLALIELVEALEAELSSQVAGFRIDDEDLEDLRTVRDAVDYVSAKLEVS